MCLVVSSLVVQPAGTNFENIEVENAIKFFYLENYHMGKALMTMVLHPD